MERKHYSPNHPAVMAWHGDREMARRRGEMLEPHVLRWYEERDSESSLAERRQAVVARARAGKKPRDKVAGLAPVGLTMVVGSGFVFDHAENVGGDWWLLTGILLGGGLALLVEAVRQSQGD